LDIPGAAAGVKQRCVQRKDEILAKLGQIQEQAQLTLDELPLRLAKDRLRLIIGLARYLATAVEMGGDAPRVSVLAEEDSATRSPAIPPA
jgi:hypothetical protein